MERKVDVAFSWHNRDFPSDKLALRAASQVVLMLLDVSCEEGKSELLLSRIFSLLNGETYRSHSDALFVWEGAWIPARNGLSIFSLEKTLEALSRSQVSQGSHKVSNGISSLFVDI